MAKTLFRSPPRLEPEQERAFARFEEILKHPERLRRFWTEIGDQTDLYSLRAGEPDEAKWEAHVRAYEEEFRRPFPAALGYFLSRWNGVQADYGTDGDPAFEWCAADKLWEPTLWSCGGGDTHVVQAFKDPGCEGSYTFGEEMGTGYFFLSHGAEPEPTVCFYRYKNRHKVWPVAKDFVGFLQLWMDGGLSAPEVLAKTGLSGWGGGRIRFT